MRRLAYTRVSTEDQSANERTSLQDQREDIRAAAGGIADWFTDDGVSGRTAEGRPGFMAVVTHCRDHPRAKADGEVWVLNSSRFGRFPNIDEFAYWRFKLRQYGYRLRTVEEAESGDDVTDAFVRTVHSAEASAYSKRLSANSRRGKRGSAERGFWQCEAPFGYRRQEIRDGVPGRVLDRGERKADDARAVLTPGPEDERAAVRDAFTRYAAGGVSLGGLSRQLASRHPMWKWSKQSVRRLLANPVYIGKHVACRGAVIRDGAHLPIIDADTWHRAQHRLTLNQHSTRAVAGEYPLAGLITCSECGHHYRGGGGKKGPDDDPERYRHYICAGAVKREPACPKPMSTVGKRLLERLVVDAVADVVTSPDVTHILSEELDRLLDNTGDEQRHERARLKREREKLSQQRQRLVGAIAVGTLRQIEAQSALQPIRDRLEEITTELDRLRFEGRRARVLSKDRSRLLNLAKDFKRTMPTLSGAAQRDFLEPWLESAVLDKWDRCLTLTIRRVPALAPFLHLSGPPGRD